MKNSWIYLVIGAIVIFSLLSIPAKKTAFKKTAGEEGFTGSELNEIVLSTNYNNILTLPPFTNYYVNGMNNLMSDSVGFRLAELTEGCPGGCLDLDETFNFSRDFSLLINPSNTEIIINNKYLQVYPDNADNFYVDIFAYNFVSGNFELKSSNLHTAQNPYICGDVNYTFNLNQDFFSGNTIRLNVSFKLYDTNAGQGSVRNAAPCYVDETSNRFFTWKYYIKNGGCAAYDTNCDSCVSRDELMVYGSKWLSHDITREVLMVAGSVWLHRDKTRC